MCESRAALRSIPRLGIRENLGENKWNMTRHCPVTPGKLVTVAVAGVGSEAKRTSMVPKRCSTCWLLGTQALWLQLFQPQISSTAQRRKSLEEETVLGPVWKKALHTSRTWDLPALLGSVFQVRFHGMWHLQLGSSHGPHRECKDADLWALFPLCTQC